MRSLDQASADSHTHRNTYRLPDAGPRWGGRPSGDRRGVAILGVGMASCARMSAMNWAMPANQLDLTSFFWLRRQCFTPSAVSFWNIRSAVSITEKIATAIGLAPIDSLTASCKRRTGNPLRRMCHRLNELGALGRLNGPAVMHDRLRLAPRTQIIVRIAESWKNISS